MYQHGREEFILRPSKIWSDSDENGALRGCPEDPCKTAPGLFGCGVCDGDRDRNGTPNFHDECPGDAANN